MQALLLAAGMGKRYGSKINKCMIEVGGRSLFERTADALRTAGISRLIVVTGYHETELENFITAHAGGMEILFVRNEDYDITNNIWSLYLAKDYFSEDDTVLLESDLIYDRFLIKELINYHNQNAAVVAKWDSWMDGTTVTLDNSNKITGIIGKREFDIRKSDISFKTVNIYKLSRKFIYDRYLPELSSYIERFGKNIFYEIAFKDIAEQPDSDFFGFIYDKFWCEIDTPEDLAFAEKSLKKFKTEDLL